MADIPDPCQAEDGRRPFVTFTPDREEQGLIIVEMHSSTAVVPSHLPRYVRGVLRLAGALIPVLDLRPAVPLALGGHVTAIVLVQLQDQAVGFMVDPTRDVVRWVDATCFADLLANEVGLTPAHGAGLARLLRPERELIILLDYRHMSRVAPEPSAPLPARPLGDSDRAERMLAHVC